MVHDPVEVVINRLQADVAGRNDPSQALIAGVDEAWEVCLLKFTMGFDPAFLG